MPRLPKPWWRESRKCWYVKINGKMTRLDPDEKKSTRMFLTLLRDSPQRSPSPTMLVTDLLERYLLWSEKNHSPKTHRRVKDTINSFAKSFKSPVRLHKLSPAHLSDWIDARCPRHPPEGAKAVTDTTRRDYLNDVLRAFNWAASPEQKLIPYSPLHGYRKPRATPRAQCLTSVQWEQLLAKIDLDDPFRDFVLVLRHTGCRPQEARIMEARHIDLAGRKVCFRDGEVPGKKGDRQILLDDEAVAILRKWALKYPEGPVLRNTRGRRWSTTAVISRFRRLRKDLKFKVSSYVARHSFATEMLEAGASAGAVAAVLGHRDPTMVLKVYGKHIETREKHLRDCIDKTVEQRHHA